ncbi:MAG: carboxylating nicotinate-nucleotide diphosphorylase [Candidatus Omnitrophica bacterium]|nr:carboxylating nicotinate-nucleotide diphosphorylase [Candidatus Omnitrophota bacterium]
MIPITPRIRRMIREALREDVGPGDVTTRTFVPKHARGEAMIFAKGNGVLAGTLVVREVLRTIDPCLKISWRKKGGSLVRAGETIAKITGPLASVLRGERVALNFLTRLSGIATLTREYVKRVHGTGVKIYDTRKTLPLWREFEKYAVRLGGGFNHRMGLWDQGFIKDNHWHFIQDSHQAARVIQKLKHRKWVVEIAKENLSDLEIILKGEPEIILLDNFSPAELKKIVRRIHKFSKKEKHRPLIEASGGIHLANVRAIAKSGVDRISVGAITHSAPALDFSLEVVKLFRP